MKSFLFFLLLFSSSLYAGKERLYITYVSSLQNKYAKELQNSGLQVYCKWGALMNDVEQIGLSSHLKKNADIKTARRLFVKYAQPFLEMINADRNLRPYLHNYPATIKELDFSISFEIDRSKNLSSQVSSVFSGYGEICYYAPNIKKIHSETYEEALKIIEEEQQAQSNESLSSSCEEAGINKN